MNFVRDIDQQSFGQEVLQRSHEIPVVVDFWAAWCAPCRTLGPALERVAQDYDGAFQLVKVDVDANQQLALQFGVKSIPMVLAFRDGKPVAQFTGAIPEHQVRAFIESILPSEADRLVDEARSFVLDGDDDAAEQLFRRVLADIPDHPDAGTGLASLLISRGHTDEAMILLGKLARTSEVERLEAAARLQANHGVDLTSLEEALAANPGDPGARFELGQALAAKGEYEVALDHLLEVVRAGGEHRGAARQAMVDVFGILGPDHPLTSVYRKALANALF